ncbi:nicotinate-nucleotide adenylyltransferase [Massilia sp. P8910]|uniref:Probable nicotinate-nucleotide adenylyltransferase n=1 Tax=Massilia antarctica TaxID=2765360 RepID=A0AA48WDK7_9BURK|nr:nicotinate-nucleotide adenylyltransferase [Massilia antarctica]MCY0911104.1 nicotinate-nucleotide adenylyltransferase [Massilia sp. H27-R4]CUI05314.1 Nicotinate-nucleotide adenylyltransferase [Janthinobacterium sp. CG23_2]MCE3604013.1 nicotinate-nucleotide adenylyltransferase [Massilia antarctica]QPI50457.1 nicotinate-nucleotide adenylyltransferase [Massilia antarctica]CUU29100.1 Nicotinate-nucleotide adenylyltransferase [Janthinobacterium sp. CG23_2]
MTLCVALLGGSFDPVHNGHVALATLFATLLEPDQLRILPAGSPWQKSRLQAGDADRIAMLRLAFAGAARPVVLDLQEIERGTPTYTIDTLRGVRAELGPQASIVFLMGSDQLQQLDSWREWRALFELAHIGVAARPGFSMADAALPAAVAEELTLRRGSLAQLRNTPSGRAYLAETLDVDISATQIRAALQRGEKANSLISPVVLDYIQQHNLYEI